MHLTTLADPVQLERVALLCVAKRPFQHAKIVKDAGGEKWACVCIGGHLFAVPGDRLKGLSFGPLAERLFWLVHHEVRDRRAAEVALSCDELRRTLWGATGNRYWLAQLRRISKSFSKLRCGDWLEDHCQSLDKALPLFEAIEEGEDAREFVFVIDEGFLGALEQFAMRAEDGIVRYEFPSRTKLRPLGKQQQVQEIYLPVYLGDPVALRKLDLSPRQNRLLQAIIRELTFPSRTTDGKKPAERSFGSGELIQGDLIRGFSGKKRVACPDLGRDVNHVGFNGNGVRRGQGYKLTTWQEKAGYAEHETNLFLEDLNVLSSALGLVIGGLDKPGKWCPLGPLGTMARDPGRRQQLEQFHVRVYARADCVEQWNRLCGWAEAREHASAAKLVADERLAKLDELREMMVSRGLQQTSVAAELGVSKQALNKALRKNQCSTQMRQRIETFLTELKGQTAATGGADDDGQRTIDPRNFVIRRPRVCAGSTDMMDRALRYHDRGWIVLPIKAEEKKPRVKWKRYQSERPDREQVVDWWTKWPDANIGVVLGPVSNLLVVDVDGEEPHRILIDLCGEIPLAPTVKSGSNDPYRYHLYFMHPEGIETGASKTPWNKRDDANKLELRGHKGILVLPPSLHKSGKRYAWVNDRSLRSVDPPELPPPLLDGLLASLTPENGATSGDAYAPGQAVTIDGLVVANSTADFIAGKYSEAIGSRNKRLFIAACDLHARGVPLEKAEPLLLKGAQPKTFDDQREAGDTIASAFSAPRKISRF